MLQVLVAGEAGAFSGNFEEDSTWLAEVDRAEVVAIYDGCDCKPCTRQSLMPRTMFFFVRGSESHVVYSSSTNHATARKIGTRHQPHLGARTTRPDLEDSRRVSIFRVLTQLPKTHHLGEYYFSRLEILHGERNSFQPPN